LTYGQDTAVSLTNEGEQCVAILGALESLTPCIFLFDLWEQSQLLAVLNELIGIQPYPSRHLTPSHFTSRGTGQGARKPLPSGRSSAARGRGETFCTCLRV
jgi:hypothetical protein